MKNIGPHNDWLSDGGGPSDSTDLNDGNGGPPGANAGSGGLFAFSTVDTSVPYPRDQTGSGSAQGSNSGTSTSLPIQPPSPTPFTIAINWDSSVTAAPTGFTSDILAVVTYLETQFTDPVTITIDVGYNEVAGNAIGGGILGESLTSLTSVSYANLLGAVNADVTTAADASVVASLPATSPVTGATYWVTTAQSKALGLSATNSAVDGYVGFGTSSLFTFGDTATAGTVAGGTYDFFATAVHEITETMGRQLLTGETFGGIANSNDLLDLLHYSAPGVRDLSSTAAGYLSVDGGVTNLGSFNTNAAGDPGDWASTVTNDPYDAFASSGALEKVSANDLTEMDAIGWNLAGQPPVNNSTPTGVTATAATASLAGAQGGSGLTAKAALATFTQTGGLAADTYLYALGGTGAASFSLTTTSNVAQLAVGSALAAGATNGKLYALTVTPTDTTSGHAGPASPVNVVVGGSGGDTITLSSLPGIVSAAPSFIYGLAGSDTIKGTGMTGKLYFDAGAGGDTLTGGTGGNVYEYGAAADSTSSAMDIITNFAVAVDLIDLTGIGTKLAYAGAIAHAGATIPAGSIGFLANGGNTYIYVNSSTASEKLTAANMKIELQGAVALTAGNFAHL